MKKIILKTGIHMYDTIIIGAGPGGMTAGIYAARREMKTLIIGKELGGQILWASEIENYPGFKSINNYELITKMQEQVKDLGVNIKMEEVKEIKKEGQTFTLKTDKDSYQSKTVIDATGLAPRRLNIPGE
ncbi:MAG TPA: FAD-dependent oxidoreductase, partial [Patescibacteria group bacterium]|nr:FAD-dependent oxidoreductase [Patescibacteria group bacterium]